MYLQPPFFFFQKRYAGLTKIPITQREKNKVWKGSKQREHRSLRAEGELMVGKMMRKKKKRNSVSHFLVFFVQIRIKRPFSRGYRVTFFFPFHFSGEKLMLLYLFK